MSTRGGAQLGRIASAVATGTTLKEWRVAARPIGLRPFFDRDAQFST